MSQRRKKVTSFQKQKIAKAQHRNEFFRKLKNVIDIINGKEVSSLISREILEEIYMLRIHSFKIIVASDSIVPSSILKDVRETISCFTRFKKITVIPGELEVTLDEFFTVVLAMFLNLENLLSDDILQFKSLKRKLKKSFKSLQTLLEEAGMKIQNMLLSISFDYNDIGKTQYWLNHEITTLNQPENGIMNLITIHSYKIEPSSIVVDDKKRPVIRMGYVFANYGIDWVSIKPSVLKVNNSFADIPLDIYIQLHALNRLSERIDCFPIGSVHYNMFISLKDPRVFYDSNNNTLIEFRYFGMKAGYFVVNIVEGMLLIRTFLFVTNTGTPEGLKLENITGLNKLDKKYLAIDKLSSFMTSDIGSHEKVRKIFTSAGCQCLLDLYENSHEIATSSSSHFDTELLLRYIEYDKKYLPESAQGPQPALNITH